MDIKQMIKRMLEVDLSLYQIAYTLDVPESDIKLIIENNIKKPTNAQLRKRPSAYPNSYYITRFKQGFTVKEIANELDCNLSGLYKLLAKRNISPYAYQRGGPTDVNATEY